MIQRSIVLVSLQRKAFQSLIGDAWVCDAAINSYFRLLHGYSFRPLSPCRIVYVT